MTAAPRPATRDEVPVLDLTPLSRGEPLAPLARELRRACETIGFFYVANHGVPQKVVDDVFDATRRYFALPVEKRLELRMDERFRRGFMPQGINQHPGYAGQYDTSVLRAHRGHRLGRLLKIAMLQWLTDEEPQLRTLDTWNAASNAHMIEVNEVLGYQVVATGIDWQLHL